jgi:hypothetical protein
VLFVFVVKAISHPSVDHRESYCSVQSCILNMVLLYFFILFKVVVKCRLLVSRSSVLLPYYNHISNRSVK